MAEDRLWQTASRAQQLGYKWGSKQFNEMLAKEVKEFQTGLIQRGRAVSGESGEKAREVSQR
jgi:hypothetical protein